jgi:wyosine [tRNA(Phe)-imidazoG37] synthetase (radical SAM superfamily)
LEENELKYIYGPVRSRRLGFSLGITTIPRKVCSFNCVYCEVGRTTTLTTERKEYVQREEVVAELKEFLAKYRGPLDHITFSGLGEPTLNSEIGYMISEIKKLTSVPVAVLSNGSLISRDDVKHDLLNANIVKFTLNAANSAEYININQSDPSIQLDAVIKGIIDFRKEFRGELWIEILLVRGLNDSERNYLALRKALGMIRPDQVHLNTVVRAPALKIATPLSMLELRQAKMLIGNGAEIIATKPSISVRHNMAPSTLFANS